MRKTKQKESSQSDSFLPRHGFFLLTHYPESPPKTNPALAGPVKYEIDFTGLARTTLTGLPAFRLLAKWGT